jgi:hypothetical protein
MLMTLRAVRVGLQSYFPGRLDTAEFNIMRGAGGTTPARYFYSVWLRHLSLAYQHGLDADPKVIAELRPGGSLGVGFAALLSGASCYYALDTVSHEAEDTPRNQVVWKELCGLFAVREPIPHEGEFPRLRPTVPFNQFPGQLTKQRLAAARQRTGEQLPIASDTLHLPREEGRCAVDTIGRLDFFSGCPRTCRQS